MSSSPIQPPPGPSEALENFSRLLAFLEVLWSRRTHLLKVLGVVVLVVVALSLLLPNYYESTATILPGSAQGTSSLLAGLSDLASLAGVNVGSSTIEALYPAIISSEAILSDVIWHVYPINGGRDSLNLVDYWGSWTGSQEDKYEKTLEKLRKELNISVDDETYLVSVALRTRYPELSAAVINRIVQNLDVFIRTKRTTNAGEQRRWIQTRLTEVERDLRKAEDSLKVFQERNRMVQSSPELLLIQGRLMRDVEINSALYIELKKQLELAIIEEIKTVPVITIMDAGRPASIEASPKRPLLIGVVSFLLMAGYLSFLALQFSMPAEYARFAERVTQFRKAIGPIFISKRKGP